MDLDLDLDMDMDMDMNMDMDMDMKLSWKGYSYRLTADINGIEKKLVVKVQIHYDVNFEEL
jgi:hypothetical protein